MTMLAEAARLKKSAAKISKALYTKPAKLKSWDFEFTLSQIIRATEGMDRELSSIEYAPIAQAANGVSYAYSSGRLPGQQHNKLRRMNGFEVVSLVGEIADKNMVIAEIPRYLIQKLQESTDAQSLIEIVLDGTSPDLAISIICEAVKESDLAKTAYSLVKSNKGNWKSEKQGLFLIDAADGYSKKILSYESSRAKDWLAKKGYDPSQFVAVAWEQMLLQYGRSDASKRRYTGTILAFDESGVLFIGTAKIIHPKEGSQDHLKIDWSKVTTKYERPKAHKPTVVINYFNRPYDTKTIDLIKSIPNYQDYDILVSFMRQLQDHGKLSPKQMVVLNKFLPEPQDVGLGSIGDLQKELETFYSHIRVKVLPSYVDAAKEYRWRADANSVSAAWKDFENGAKYSHPSIVDGIRLVVSQIYDKVSNRPKKLYNGDFFHWMRDKVKRAAKAKSPGKAHVEAIESLRWLNKQLETLTVSKVRSALQLDKD